MKTFDEWWAEHRAFILARIEDWSPKQMMRTAYDSALPEWQPIETAPESGPFLVYGGMFRSELYADSKTREAVKVSGRAPYIMFHNKGEILFYVADANYHEVWVVNPTHWMPLPEAPQGDEK